MTIEDVKNFLDEEQVAARSETAAQFILMAFDAGEQDSLSADDTLDYLYQFCNAQAAARQ